MEDNSEKYSNRSRIESDKEHISYSCREYFSCIHAFCENGENILIDAKLKKQRQHLQSLFLIALCEKNQLIIKQKKVYE